MAHFAELKTKVDPTGFTSDTHQIVERVVVVGNDIETAAGSLGENDMHADGETWCVNFFNGGIWKQTSYNHNFRKQYAGIGFVYDPIKDKFLTQQPHASWSLDASDDWQAPITYPTVTEEGDVKYIISWNETKYQADNTKGWEATKSNDTSETPTKYDWNGTAWVSEQETQMARSNGGIIGKINKTSFGKCTVTSKTSTGTFTTQPGTRVIDALLVGGGGAGGRNANGTFDGGAGGGGAGGYLSQTCLSVFGNTPYPATIGAGGTVPANANPGQPGGSGNNSTLVIGSTTYTAGLGGGGGGTEPAPSADGVSAPLGSGGGGGSSDGPLTPGSGGSGGPQGNAGGPTSSSTQNYAGGGGGGANAAGTASADSPNANGGAGGAGTANSISGSCVTYAGGGGGGGNTSGGAGGAGGGGTGGRTASSTDGTAGTANTGGGGGGAGRASAANAANGGSGVVIVKELSKASGVWSMQSQFSAKNQGTWPRLLINYSLDYLVVAGGGGGGGNKPGYNENGGGGGAGGYRASGYGPSPLQAPALTIQEGSYTITVGGGGTGMAPGGPTSSTQGNSSVVDSITSAGGGRGGGSENGAGAGGSGGGRQGWSNASAASGNSPPVSPPQGNNGGLGYGSPHPHGSESGGGGGGGATAVGTNTCNNSGGPGGAGAPNTILGPDTTYAGGGGGDGPSGAGSGGAGGGGSDGGNGTDNTGGGGGGGNHGQNGGAGGPGIVVVRGPSAVTFAVTPCTNTTGTVPSSTDKFAKFTVSGTLTVS